MHKFGTGFVRFLIGDQKLNFNIRNNLNKTLAQNGELVKINMLCSLPEWENLYITQFSSSRFVMNREDFFYSQKKVNR